MAFCLQIIEALINLHESKRVSDFPSTRNDDTTDLFFEEKIHLLNSAFAFSPIANPSKVISVNLEVDLTVTLVIRASPNPPSI